MGLSSIKGNGGYIGVDKRGEVSSSGSTGNISVRKHYLERRRGNLTPEPPTTDVLFQDNFSSGDLSKWSVYNGSQNSQWVVGDSTSCLNENGDSQTIPSGSTFAAYLSDDNGVTNTYEDNTNAHMVFGFTIPDDVTITTLTLEFDWMCSGPVATIEWMSLGTHRMSSENTGVRSPLPAPLPLLREGERELF